MTRETPPARVTNTRPPRRGAPHLTDACWWAAYCLLLTAFVLFMHYR